MRPTLDPAVEFTVREALRVKGETLPKRATARPLKNERTVSVSRQKRNERGPLMLHKSQSGTIMKLCASSPYQH